VIAVLVVALAAGCDRAEPAPLPEPVLVSKAWDARMVKAPGVSGYLARPTAEGEHDAVLLLVPAIDLAARAEAEARAETGLVALAVGPDSDDARALAYLSALPHVRAVRVECRRPSCPEAGAG
jgi:hypothetical protein